MTDKSDPSVGRAVMHGRGWIVVAAALGIVEAAAAAAPAQAPRYYPVKPVPFTAVHFTDAFWLPRIETNRTVSIPFAFEKCEETKRVYHFERAGAALRGEQLKDKEPPGYPFDDTDLYKVIEGAAYTLSVKKDPSSRPSSTRSSRRSRAPRRRTATSTRRGLFPPRAPAPVAGTKRWESRRKTAMSCTTWDTSTRRRSRTTRPPEADAARRGRGTPGTSSIPARSVRTSSRSGPGTRSPRWGWSSSTA